NMAGSKTLTMLKPDAVERWYNGAILDEITTTGIRITAMKMTRMTKGEAQTFYTGHKDRPYCGDLVDYMTPGTIVAAIIEKNKAVEDFRELIGTTKTEEPAKETIQKKYADSIAENAINGSDSDENAEIEGNFHFAQKDTF